MTFLTALLAMATERAGRLHLEMLSILERLDPVNKMSSTNRS